MNPRPFLAGNTPRTTLPRKFFRQESFGKATDNETTHSWRSGYLGSALIPRLLERQYTVDVVDLFWFGNHLPPETGVVNADIFSLQVSDLAGYDQVVFLAGLSNDPMAEYSPSKNFVFNAAAPAYLAYMAKRAGARRFVYASSCSVYGYTENELYDEAKPVSSVYPYGIPNYRGNRR